MKRRAFLKTGVAAGVLFPLPGIGWNPFEGGTFVDLRRGTGTYVNKGGTIGWLIRDDAVAIVDTQFPDSAALCIGGIKKRTTKRINYLVNSHHHGDHTRGNGAFRDHVDEIVAHANVPQLQHAQAKERGWDDVVVADRTYEKTLKLEAGDETLALYYHGPAHTSGDTVIHFEKANVAHIGDLVFNRYPPYVDRGAGATVKGWMPVLEEVHDRFDDETLFIFGHGKTITGSRADLLRFRDFLGGLLNHVGSGIRDGKTRDEISSISMLPDFPDNYTEDWKDGIPNAIKATYDELMED